MLNTFDIGIDNALAFQVSGKITEDDMVDILAEARNKLQQHEHIVILEQIDSFKGIELKAIMEEFRFLKDVGLKNIDKVAVVTDKGWIETITNVSGKLFSDMDVHCFSVDEKDEAIAFLKTH